jgi:hypothetical protein
MPIFFIPSHLTGNDAIHFLTKSHQELRVDLLSFDDEKAHAHYSTFKVADENSKYQLTVSGYSGTAGMSGVHHHKTKNGLHTKHRTSSYKHVFIQYNRTMDTSNVSQNEMH